MKCATALDRLLEADRAELEGQGESELAQHVRTCERCRAAAEHIMTGEGALRAAVARSGPTVAVDDALRHAARAPAPRPSRRSLWQVAVPAALAAGLTGIVLWGPWRQGLGPGAVVPPPTSEAAPGLNVRVPPGQNVAVFDGVNGSDIVVVWFY